MPRVSFYTTALRPDDNLRRTHESLHHCGVDFEHVVTVAESFDEIFNFLPKTSEKLKVIPAPQSDISEGFNRAISHCSGDYLMVANSGDRVLDAMPLVKALEANQSLDFAYGDIRLENRLIKAHPSPITRRDCIVHAMCFCHGAAMTRADFHKKYGLYDSGFKRAMDFALFFSAIERGARMVHLPLVIAEIEKPKVSGQLLERTRENILILRRSVGPHIVYPIACKWLLASLLARALTALRSYA